MTFDLDAARGFMGGHARLLDRLRFEALLGAVAPEQVLGALAAYRNPDGGFGWGLEPDLRAPGSQPAAAMHAMEVFAEAAVAAPGAVALCDWLQRHTLPGGGLPFALPVPDPAATSPIWTGADPAAPSLQMTAQVAAHAHRLAPRHAAIARHPWLQTATRFCLDAIAALDADPPAHVILFALRFLDAAAPRVPEADAALEALRPHLPAHGRLAVRGGAEGEALHPLDLSPFPGLPSRRLFDAALIEGDLGRLRRGQQPDGGWSIDFDAASAASALEWRGYVTVHAVAVLRAS